MPGVRHGYRSSSTSSDAPSPAPGTVLIEAGEYSPLGQTDVPQLTQN